MLRKSQQIFSITKIDGIHFIKIKLKKVLAQIKRSSSFTKLRSNGERLWNYENEALEIYNKSQVSKNTNLKCFNKELLAVLSTEFKVLKSCFYEKHVIDVL